MTLRYETEKEFSGIYNRTTMLIFTDNKIDKENCQLITKIIKLYEGHSGEFIDYKILYDDINYIYKILVIIICFKTLLVDVSKKEYNNFIKSHKNNFMEYYNKVVPILVE
jgi:hypothetical protein